MAIHNELGKRGEEEALAFLLKKGFVLREKNWRFGKEEIDLIVETPGQLVIVEVKARSTDSYGNPYEFISRAKQKHLIRAANAYVEKLGINKDIRFDIIAITYKPAFLLEHIPEAFYP